MRRFAPWSLALVGLALAIPISARAGQPEKPSNASDYRSARYFAGHLCKTCAAKLPKRLPATGPVMLMPGEEVNVAELTAGSPRLCMACQSENAAPGMAFVGGEAPGYATVGGDMMASAEPMPIGVMRTNYQSGFGAAPAAPTYPALGSMGSSAGAFLPNSHAPMSDPMVYPGHRRQSIIGHMLGLPSKGPIGAMREARAERRRVGHAAIRYDDTPMSPESLPSSMVYGRR